MKTVQLSDESQKALLELRPLLLQLKVAQKNE